jgi:hypothetical protein
MQMLYNSDSYVVVQFESSAELAQMHDGVAPSQADAGPPVAVRGGFEIVDKFARKDIFIEGALAERFRRGVNELVASSPEGASPEQLDEYISGFTAMAQHPLVLH